jgi:hypothetical protein
MMHYDDETTTMHPQHTARAKTMESPHLKLRLLHHQPQKAKNALISTPNPSLLQHQPMAQPKNVWAMALQPVAEKLEALVKENENAHLQPDGAQNSCYRHHLQADHYVMVRAVVVYKHFDLSAKHPQSALALHAPLQHERK